MDESSPEYQKAKKRKSEIESSIRHYEVKLSSALHNLDMGFPGKADVAYSTDKINKLLEEKSELESQCPKHYSNQEIADLERSVSHYERKKYAMIHEQEVLGIPYVNELSFYDYKITKLKQEFRNAQKSQG